MGSCLSTNSKPKLQIKLTHKDARMPIYSYPTSAGLDIFACETSIIPASDKTIINCGLIFIIPPGYYGSLRGRSSLAAHHGIILFEGTIDEDYTSNCYLIFFNLSKVDYKIEKGQRIAQFILCESKQKQMELREIDNIEKFVKKSIRKKGALGSSGK